MLSAIADKKDEKAIHAHTKSKGTVTGTVPLNIQLRIDITFKL